MVYLLTMMETQSYDKYTKTALSANISTHVKATGHFKNFTTLRRQYQSTNQSINQSQSIQCYYNSLNERTIYGKIHPNMTVMSFASTQYCQVHGIVCQINAILADKETIHELKKYPHKILNMVFNMKYVVLEVHADSTACAKCSSYVHDVYSQAGLHCANTVVISEKQF